MPKSSPRSSKARAKVARDKIAPTKAVYHHGDLRNALIAAGLKILAQEGAQALTLRAVARQAQVSHAAPYRHFASKEALLAAIAEEGFNELSQRLSETRENFGSDPRQLLQGIAWAYIKFAQDKPDHWRIMFSNLIADREAYPSLMTAGLSSFNLLVDMIRAGQASGGISEGDPQLLALAGWSMVHGLSMLLIEDQVRLTVGERAAEPLARALADIYLFGVAKKA